MLNRSTNKFLFSLVKKKPLYIFSSWALNLVTAILDVVATLLSVLILATLLGGKHYLFDAPTIVQYLLSLYENIAIENRLLVISISTALIIILKNIVNYASTVISFKYTRDLVFQMKAQSLELLCKVDIDYYYKNKAGDILFKFNREIERSVLAIKSCQNIFVISSIILIFTILLIAISWQLTLISLILIGFIIIVNRLLVSCSKKSRINLLQESRFSNRQLINFLTGIRLIKSVANELGEYQAIKRSLEDKTRSQLNAQLVSATVNPVTEVAVITVVIGLILAEHYWYFQSIQEVSFFIIYLVIFLRLLSFIQQLNNARVQFVGNLPSVKVVANFLTESNRSIIKSGTVAFNKLQRGIEFHNVTFAYPDRPNLALDQIKIKINSGQTIAVLSSNQFSKSAISDLLIRFYDPAQGKITLDGKNLKDYELNSLRKAIAVVSQDTFIFNNSLAYNLTYGLKNISKTELIAAAKKARIFQFANHLPEGFATEVGDRGVVLSQKLKQKIGIARAFLRNPEIVILNEPNSILNSPDPSVEEAIETLCCDRTTLILTRHPATAKKADLIVVLDRGIVRETGTHKKLLQQGNIYQRLYSAQFKTSQQFRQHKLAQKIARKLARQTNSNLSWDQSKLDALLSWLQLVNESLLEDEQLENKILDQSYQSAKNTLASLKEYESKISQELKDPDND
ncbi:ABC transporter ATP-binding protein [Pleurocapsales cyanobacterium LEGE 10410]|nr:ABC transporter ATP-binding protein [Pleurocapsales cyanobacterium LEGE 10410]